MDKESSQVRTAHFSKKLNFTSPLEANACTNAEWIHILTKLVAFLACTYLHYLLFIMKYFLEFSVQVNKMFKWTKRSHQTLNWKKKKRHDLNNNSTDALYKTTCVSQLSAHCNQPPSQLRLTPHSANVALTHFRALQLLTWIIMFLFFFVFVFDRLTILIQPPIWTATKTLCHSENDHTPTLCMSNFRFKELLGSTFTFILWSIKFLTWRMGVCAFFCCSSVRIWQGKWWHKHN